MTAILLSKRIHPLRPKFYVELFDTDSVFLAATRSIGKKLLRFLVDSKITKAPGDRISGALYGFRSGNFVPFSGIVRLRKEVPSRFFPELCELELESEEDFSESLPEN